MTTLGAQGQSPFDPDHTRIERVLCFTAHPDDIDFGAGVVSGAAGGWVGSSATTALEGAGTGSFRRAYRVVHGHNGRALGLEYRASGEAAPIGEPFQRVADTGAVYAAGTDAADGRAARADPARRQRQRRHR